MNFQIALLIVSLFVLGLKASNEPKCTDMLEGDSGTIPLDSPKKNDDALTWKCGENEELMYKRRKGREDNKPNVKVDDKGSLTLANISKAMAFTCKVEHFDGNGKLLKKDSFRICVISRPVRPTLKVDCSKSLPTLHCEPKQYDKDLTLSWVKNDKPISEKANPLQLSKRGEEFLYKCKLGNHLRTETSSEVSASCGVDDKLFGYNKWMMIGIIAGGGFLLLVLILSLITICCKNHHRRKRRLQDEEELRLANLQYIGTTPRPKQTARGQPVPPIPDEQGYYQGPEGEPEPSPVAPQARKQPRPRAPPPPMEDDDEAIPPLPQPRKKGHRRPDN